MKISILLAFRNRENFIRKCLDSIVAQTIINETEIIALDSSEENEKDIIFQYKRLYPTLSIKYIQVKKLGLYHAWNTGIKAASGKYIVNLNSDDRLKKDALEIMSNALDENPDIALVYCDSLITDTPNETFSKNSSKGRLTDWPDYSHKVLLMKCFCGPHPMWRKKIHNKIGYFDENFKMRADYEFWLRIAENYKMLHIPETVGLYYNNPEGISASSPQLACDEDLKIKLKYLQQK